MSFQILKAFSHSWSALLFWGPQGAGPVYGEADRRIISLLIMRPRWRTRIGGILINKIMSTRWHLRPHLIRLDCGIQCFERHDGYERFIGKFSCQCSVFIRVSLAVQIRLWQGEPRSAMWFRSYGGNGVVLTMKTEQNTSLCSVLWSSSSSIASALSIRKLQSSLHYTANIINLGGDKSEETLIIMLTLCLLFQETQFEVSNIKLEGFSKC